MKTSSLNNLKIFNKGVITGEKIFIIITLTSFLAINYTKQKSIIKRSHLTNEFLIVLMSEWRFNYSLQCSGVDSFNSEEYVLRLNI